ncbi:MAG: hypothetical protein NXI09_08525 [Bacteroidetes bacterium]|nr:hypothetical protein [Bacteroidota bacterium]
MKYSFLFLFLNFQNIGLAQAFELQGLQCPNEENSFRGISALDENRVWLCSDQGEVWYYSVDGGWEDRSPHRYESIMWRDIEAFNDSTAVILSAGSPGVILRTENSGNSWYEVYRDESEDIFFDAMDFKGPFGFAFSDARDGYTLDILQSRDYGQSWQLFNSEPARLVNHENQGGFAASGTCLKALGDSSFIIVLGGAAASFKYVLDFNNCLDRDLPIDSGANSKGAFSVDLNDEGHILVVGGDYRADSLSNNTMAISRDFGNSWSEAPFPKHLQSRYWSCVQWQGTNIFLSSRYGCAFSFDNGKSWELSDEAYYSIDQYWLSGPKGRLGRLLQ